MTNTLDLTPEEYLFEEMAEGSDDRPILSIEDTSREVIYVDHD